MSFSHWSGLSSKEGKDRFAMFHVNKDDSLTKDEFCSGRGMGKGKGMGKGMGQGQGTGTSQ
jgi:hypothetical protein